MARTSKASRIPIPAPDFSGDLPQFLPIVKHWSRNIPFGYEEDEDDPDILQPIPEELLLLVEAEKYLERGYSYRDVAAWISSRSGRNISHQGLKGRLEQQVTGKKRLYTTKSIAKHLARFYAKSRYLDSRILGRTKPETEELKEELLQIVDQAAPYQPREGF